MYENLIKYIHDMLGKDKKNAGLLKYMINNISQAEPLLDNQAAKPNLVQSSSKSDKKKTEILKMSRQEKILDITKEFINEFESSLQGGYIKNYLVFLLTVFRISKKLKSDHDKGIIFALTLSRLSQMLARYPVNYQSRAFREPLGFLFLVTEFAVRSARNLKSPYKFEEIILLQFIPLVKKFCLDSENPLQEIVNEISEMPKFRIDVKIGEVHQNIIKNVLVHCLPKISLKIRLESATRLLNKITHEINDSDVLLHYNTLRLFFEKDNELRAILSKMAKKELDKKYRRFVNTILEELSGL